MAKASGFTPQSVSDGGELYVKSKLIFNLAPMRMDDLTKMVEQIGGVEWQKER